MNFVKFLTIPVLQNTSRRLLLERLRNYNEIFCKNVINDNIKSHNKLRLHDFSEKYIFGKIAREVKFTTPPLYPSPFRVNSNLVFEKIECFSNLKSQIVDHCRQIFIQYYFQKVHVLSFVGLDESS